MAVQGQSGALCRGKGRPYRRRGPKGCATRRAWGGSRVRTEPALRLARGARGMDLVLRRPRFPLSQLGGSLLTPRLLVPEGREAEAARSRHEAAAGFPDGF